VRPRKIDPAIPRDLETIILKCLAGEPSKRYQTATALAADLRRFLEDRPIRARRASRVERAWRWCRRNPALAAMSALAALLLVAFATTASIGYVHTTKAYAGASRALGRAEATSRLSLEVLDDIYLQLSPDRVWISSDSDPGGDACACIGLRSGAGPASSAERAAMQVQVSKETASLLENLLVFYDRLAEQAGDDFHVMLQSAIASRRVGDIRQRLGQLDQAEEEYTRAVEKLTALSRRPDADVRVRTELARCHNEIGNVRSARFEPSGAYQAHRSAFSVLHCPEPAGRSPEGYRYELARTLYFLSSKRPSAPVGRRGDKLLENAPTPGPRLDPGSECRTSAVRILEELAGENPDAPDYRFLLALCHRPSGSGPDPARSPASARGRQQAIRILEELKAQYPGVVDYRYELTATYAWVHVGLFPWQRPSVAPSKAERGLLKALDESQWLVSHNPTIPLYARSETLILAKLGTICWRTGRLAEAEDFFQKALQTQTTLMAEFPDLPSHNRVLLEFARLRLGQVYYERNIGAPDAAALSRSRDLLQTCIENLTQLAERPELAEDRLVCSSLPLAYDVLSRVLGEIGEHEKAEEAKKKGKAMRAVIPDGRRHHWQL
jgi:tetratricopeptide (TPR) repeat protein